MGWVQLCGDRQMLHCFFEAYVFLKDLVAEPIVAEESFGTLGDHLTECINVHSAYDLNWTRTIALEWQDQLHENVGKRNGADILHGREGVVVGAVDRVGKVVDGLLALTVTVRTPEAEVGALLAI